MIHATDERLGDLALSRLRPWPGGIGNHPIVAWDNLMRRAALSGDAVASDGALANAATWTTYDRWRPAGTGARQITALIGADEAPVTFLALAAHNLFAIGATVQWAYNLAESGGSWVGLNALAAEDGVMAWRIMPVAARRWRLSVTVPAGASANVGCVFIGAETVLPTRIYQGFSPRIRPTEIELESNVSEGGNLLASAIVRTGSTLSMDLAYLPETFARSEDFGGFMEWFNRARGVYVAWMPEKYPQDVHYGWRGGSVLRPDNSGPKDFMSASIAMRLFDG
ncbi:MAG TPA: hypothetical protein VGC31_09565 [Paenirhodobacter sp.]